MLLMGILTAVVVVLLAVDEMRIRKLRARNAHLRQSLEMWKLAAEHWERAANSW